MPSHFYSERYQQFLEKLQRAREEAGLTQEQAGVLLDRDQSFVSRYETGERRVDVTELEEFATIYEKSVLYFLNEG